MDGDTTDAITRPPECKICGSTAHSRGGHDSAGPSDDYSAPAGHVGTGTIPMDFATEEIVVEDDDAR